MRLFPIAAVLLLAGVPLAAQKSKTSASKPTASAVAALPTEAEVNEFLRRMFGYDSSLTWKVQAIVPAEAPGVAHVVASIGGQPRAIHLYVLPGKKFAVVGEPIPFGSDPFGPVRQTLSAKATGAQRGATGAIVTLVEFSDLQCPFCKGAQPIIDRLVSEIPDAKLVFQPFPLPMHPWAMKAATFGECIRRQKTPAFWEFVNQVYADQANITEANADEKLKAIAVAAGVDGDQASACARTPEVAREIQQSIDLGKSVGVNSTPTLFIQGRRITGIADILFEQLKAMVEFEVAEAKSKRAQ